MKKSQLLQFLLTLLLGPIGLFYSSTVAAIVLLVAAIALNSVVGLIGSVILWGISIFVGFFTTSKYNATIDKEDEKHRAPGQVEVNQNESDSA